VYIYAEAQLSNVAPAAVAATRAEVAEFVLEGCATPKEIMAYYECCKSYYIKIGVLKDGACVDAAVFRDLATAEDFLADGVWPGADGVVKLPDDFGIGDAFNGRSWTRQEVEAAAAEEMSGESLEVL